MAIKQGMRVRVHKPKPEDNLVSKFISHGLYKSGTIKTVSDEGSFWVDFDDGSNGIYNPDEVEVLK